MDSISSSGSLRRHERQIHRQRVLVRVTCTLIRSSATPPHPAHWIGSDRSGTLTSMARKTLPPPTPSEVAVYAVVGVWEGWFDLIEVENRLKEIDQPYSQRRIHQAVEQLVAAGVVQKVEMRPRNKYRFVRDHRASPYTRRLDKGILAQAATADMSK